MLISKKTDSGISLTTAWVMEHKNVEFVEEFRKNCSVSFFRKSDQQIPVLFPGPRISSLAKVIL